MAVSIACYKTFIGDTIFGFSIAGSGSYLSYFTETPWFKDDGNPYLVNPVVRRDWTTALTFFREIGLLITV